MLAHRTTSGRGLPAELTTWPLTTPDCAVPSPPPPPPELPPPSVPEEVLLSQPARLPIRHAITDHLSSVCLMSVSCGGRRQEAPPVKRVAMIALPATRQFTSGVPRRHRLPTSGLTRKSRSR